MVNYTIVEFPVEDLTPFNTWAGSDVFPGNVAFPYDGIADNMEPPLVDIGLYAAGGDAVQFDIIPTDPSEYYTTVEMFNIGGQTPTNEGEIGTDPGPGFTEGMTLRSRVWIAGSTVYNTAGNQINCVLHPWISEVHMFDMLPVLTPYPNNIMAQNLYPHRWIRVVAIIADPNTVIPPYDYDIILDLDGDAQPHPPPFTGSSFNIDCEIFGDQEGYGGAVCSKVYPMIPPCYNTLNDSGWVFYPVLIDDYNARIVCTYTCSDPNQPLDLTCDNQNPYWDQGNVGQFANIQPWFHISPNGGYILSRWNCGIPEEFQGEDFSINPSSEAFFLTGVEMVGGGYLDLGVYGASIANTYKWEVTNFDDFNIGSTSLVEYTPQNFAGVDPYPYTVDNQGYDLKNLALVDTVLPPIDNAQIVPIVSNIGGAQTELYGNNVIVMFRGLHGYIPGPNPPDLKIKISVNNCAMIGGGSFEEEWIYFEDISIYEVEDIINEIDITTIDGENFGEEWGEDE